MAELRSLNGGSYFFKGGPDEFTYHIECRFAPEVSRVTKRCNDCNKFTGSKMQCKHCGSTNLKQIWISKKKPMPDIEEINKVLQKFGLFTVSVDMSVRAGY